MNKTRIEWADYSWNPLKGLCPVGCWYCYARKMYKRFKWDPDLNLQGFNWFPEKPSRIFICSTMEMFHPVVPNDWRYYIFKSISLFPQHTFIVLTKMPENIDRTILDNTWLGISVADPSDYYKRIGYLEDANAKNKFMSIEPLLQYDSINLGEIEVPEWLNWIIVGKLTGHGEEYNPRKEWIEDIVLKARDLNIPVFLKNNLKNIWPYPLIQEFPE